MEQNHYSWAFSRLSVNYWLWLKFNLANNVPDFVLFLRRNTRVTRHESRSLTVNCPLMDWRYKPHLLALTSNQLIFKLAQLINIHRFIALLFLHFQYYLLSHAIYVLCLDLWFSKKSLDEIERSLVDKRSQAKWEGRVGITWLSLNVEVIS
jgi:hypothetical protein